MLPRRAVLLCMHVGALDGVQAPRRRPVLGGHSSDMACRFPMPSACSERTPLPWQEIELPEVPEEVSTMTERCLVRARPRDGALEGRGAKPLCKRKRLPHWLVKWVRRGSAPQERERLAHGGGCPLNLSTLHHSPPPRAAAAPA